MNALINSALFSQTSIDSGALNLLGKVIHQFPQPGYYLGSVLNGEQVVGRFHLTVDPKNNLPQTNIDLASLVPGLGVPCPTCPPGSGEAQFTVNPKGYVLFYVSRGTGGYAVTVSNGFTPEAKVVFDSRNLQTGDYFVAQILQPGQYKATNLANQQVHTLVMGKAPAVGNKPFVPLAPLMMQVHPTGFVLGLNTGTQGGPVAPPAPSPAPVNTNLGFLQPKVYQIQTPTRIRIDLTSPASS